MYCFHEIHTLSYVISKESVSEISIEGDTLVVPMDATMETISGWLKTEAEKIIEERVARYASIMGVNYAGVEMSEAKERWGSCSSKDSLNFAWRLVLAPLGIIDYVVKGTNECEIVDELKNVGGYTAIGKNSANGFHTSEFRSFMTDNPEIDTYLVCGNATDASIMNFCISLKTYFDEFNKKSRIIIPMNAIETYDMDKHNGELCNIMAIKFMENTGVKIVKGVL